MKNSRRKRGLDREQIYLLNVEGWSLGRVKNTPRPVLHRIAHRAMQRNQRAAYDHARHPYTHVAQDGFTDRKIRADWGDTRKEQRRRRYRKAYKPYHLNDPVWSKTRQKGAKNAAQTQPGA